MIQFDPIKTMNITEGENEITKNIDVATPMEMVKYFHQCDSQMYDGYLNYDSIKNQVILEKMLLLSQLMKKHYKTTEKNIFLCGSGTSGRIGYFCSKNYNSILKTQNFSYLIAGGDRALVKSQGMDSNLI